LELDEEEGMVQRDSFNLDFVEHVKDITVFPLQREMAFGILCHEWRTHNLTFFEAIIDPKLTDEDQGSPTSQKKRNTNDDIEFDPNAEGATQHPLDSKGWLNIHTRWIVNVPSIEEFKNLKVHNF